MLTSFYDKLLRYKEEIEKLYVVSPIFCDQSANNYNGIKRNKITCSISGKDTFLYMYVRKSRLKLDNAQFTGKM